MADIKHHTYDTREALAEGLAAGVAAVLAGGIATRGAASLAVSGGSTPKLFFKHLAAADIAWDKVTIILVDERIVPPDHKRSNARLVRETLLRDRAAAARFLAYDTEAESLEDIEAQAAGCVAQIAPRLDVAILGMGTDGHTASFFSRSKRLLTALDLETKNDIIATEIAGEDEARLTLTLPFLLDARFLGLHIEGEEKKAVLDEALAGRDQVEMPVRSVLLQSVTDLNIFWAP